MNDLTGEELNMPHKGKASSFFELENNMPNAKQMNFIYEHYPEYGSEPDYTHIFTWFKTQALESETTHK